MTTVYFKVCRWLDNDDYKLLTEFSEYEGRKDGCSIFRLDFHKMKRNGYTLLDVVSILEDLEGVDEGGIDAIRRLAEELRKAVIELGEDGRIHVRSRFYLKPVFEEARILLPYDPAKKAYTAPGHLYARLRDILEGAGLVVEDRTGILERRLPRKLTFRGELREYQKEALQAWAEAGYRGVIVLPTGAGKTVVAIAGMAMLNLWTLVVVYTKEHVKQWMDSIRKFTDAGGLVGAYYGDEKRLSPITVTTYQTAYRKIRLFADKFPFIIFDEAHHLPADKFRTIATGMLAPYRMGLSATIKREDGRHEELFSLLGGVVYNSTPHDLMKKGYLAPYRIVRVKVDPLPEEKARYEKLKKEYRLLAAGRTFQEILSAAKKGDKTAIEALRRHAEMREIIQSSRAKLKEVTRIALEEARKGRKVIVFTQYRKQAEEIAKMTGGMLLHGGLDKDTRQRILDRFKNSDSGILVVTTVGDEGLDIPDAEVGILASGTGSSRQFIQRLGRLIRPMPGKTAVLYEVVLAGTSEEYQSRRRRQMSL